MATTGMILELIGPDVDGESQIAAYVNKIDIQNFNVGFAQAADAQRGGGSAASVSTAMDLSVVKFLDASSSNLAIMCLTGAHFDEVIVTVLKSSGADEKEWFYRVTLTDVIVSSYNISGSGAGTPASESVSFNYKVIKTEYQKQDDSDGTMSDGGSMEYDAAAGAKLS